MHATIAMFGDLEFLKKFGKSGTENDLIIRNQAESGHILTFVAPNSDKVQPLLQAAAMADYPVVVVNDITADIGEVLILLNEMDFSSGLIVTDFFEEKIRELIKDMNIKNFEFVRKDEIIVREKIFALSIVRPNEPAIVTIDNYFPVKGVGTVILGLVKSGQVKQYDSMTIYPIKKEVTIKSMQSQDRDVKETESGQRIGLAIKGVETDELKRGYIFSDAEIKCEKTFDVNVRKCKYSKFTFEKGKRLMVCIGQQVIGCEIKSVEANKIQIELDSPIAIYIDKCILATSDLSQRTIGSGKIVN